MQQAAKVVMDEAMEAPIAFMPQFLAVAKARVGGTVGGQRNICDPPDLSQLRMKIEVAERRFAERWVPTSHAASPRWCRCSSSSRSSSSRCRSCSRVTRRVVIAGGQKATPEGIARGARGAPSRRAVRAAVRASGSAMRSRATSARRSSTTRRSSAVDRGQRFPVTLSLALGALVLTVLIGLPLGILAAVKQGGSSTGSSPRPRAWRSPMPDFWLGMILLLDLRGEPQGAAVARLRRRSPNRRQGGRRTSTCRGSRWACPVVPGSPGRCAAR